MMKLESAIKTANEQLKESEVKTIPAALKKLGTFSLRKPGWIIGKANDGSAVAIKAFEAPSSYSINGGQVSKLWIKALHGKVLVDYDRDWNEKPVKGTPEYNLAKEILAAFTELPSDPAEVHPDRMLEDSLTPADVQAAYHANLKNIKDKKAALKATAQDLGLRGLVISASGKLKKYKPAKGNWVSGARSMIKKSTKEK